VSLEVAGVRHSFGGRTALADVSFTVAPGVLTGLLGPNGAGKTTLMRIMLGVLVPDAGEIRHAAQGVDSADRTTWGYMPQERGLYPAMPAGEQVVHFGRLHGLSAAEAHRRARDLLEELGLADRWADRTDKLSGGMQQRLQLATALIHDPDVMVLDEPFSGLDPLAVAELSETLARRTRAGAIVLFSSHQLDLVQDLCEEIVMIDRGRVVLEGAVAELRAGSGERRLRLSTSGGDETWLAGLPGVEVVSRHADGVRLTMPEGTDPLAVLDAARAVGRVRDFGLDLPSLSELFLTVAAERAADEARR